MTKNKGMGPVAAGLVGAAVGAAVGATAVALSDEKNRKAIGDKFNEVKEEGKKAFSEAKDKVENMVEEGKDKVDEAKKKVAKKLE